MPTLNQPSPGIYVVHLPLPMKPSIINVTLIDGGGEWALVDTGIDTEDSHAALLAAMREVGCERAALRQILVTHHHPDHFGASAWLQESFGARVVMHHVEYESSTHYAPGRRGEESIAFFHLHGLPMDRFARVPSPGEFWAKLYRPAVPEAYLSDGDVVRVGNIEFEVVTTPGHTGGHCMLYARDRRLLISGDHLLPKITPHVGFFPGGPADPLGNFLDSQRKARALEVDIVLPAHGGTYSHHRQRIDQILQHHEYRLLEILDSIRRKPLTGYEAARIAFGFDLEAPLTMQFPATFETLAHLERLCHAGKARREEQGGQVRYSAV